MIEIFLSHNTRDREWCEWLKASAGEMGISAYLAEHDLQPGKNLAAKVTAAIDRSQAVVVLLSDNSISAPYVNQEIGYALRAEKLIIPLVAPTIRAEQLAMLQGVEYIPFDFANPHEGHTQLRRALQTLVSSQPKKEQRPDTALLVLACLALVLLAVNE